MRIHKAPDSGLSLIQPFRISQYHDIGLTQQLLNFFKHLLTVTSVVATLRVPRPAGRDHMLLRSPFLTLLTCVTLLTGCQGQIRPQENSQPEADTTSPAPATTANAQTAPVIRKPAGSTREAIKELYNDYMQLRLDHSPALASRLAMAPDRAWDDLSQKEEQRYRQQLIELQLRSQAIKIKELSGLQHLYFNAFQLQITRQLQLDQCRLLQYSYSYDNSWNRTLVDILERTQVDNIQDFHRYLDRIEAIPTLFNQWQAQITEAANAGIVPPDSARKAVIRQLDQQLSGYPFSDSAAPSRIWKDLHSKLRQLNLYPKTEALLEDKARSTLTNYMLPALRQMRSDLQTTTAPVDQNMKLLPGGDACYRLWLTREGAQISAEALHDQGKAELQALQEDLIKALNLDRGVAFAPQLRAWIASSASLPDDLPAQARTRLETVNKQLPKAFAYLPGTPLVIQANTDKARADSWYQEPLAELNRPGIYWIDKNAAPSVLRWPLDLYRDSLPGKHLQVALAQENLRLPEFLRTSALHPYAPGWPTVAARLALELNGYQSNAEANRVLLQELEESLNLVLDTGIHLYQWSRELSLTYCQDNSFLDRGDCMERIDQIMQKPASFSAIAISRHNLEELQDLAIKEGGSQFDINRWRSDLLSQGALPASLYNEWLKIWISSQH